MSVRPLLLFFKPLLYKIDYSSLTYIRRRTIEIGSRDSRSTVKGLMRRNLLIIKIIYYNGVANYHCHSKLKLNLLTQLFNLFFCLTNVDLGEEYFDLAILSLLLTYKGGTLHPASISNFLNKESFRSKAS